MASATLLRRPAVQLALALCAVAAVTTTLGRLANGPKLQEKRKALDNGAGVEQYPSFSPDGNRLVYSARGVTKDDSFHIFLRTLPSGAPRQLTYGKANDVGPVWSRDGVNIAFLRVSEGRAHYIVVPASGGSGVRTAAESAAPDESQPGPSLSWAKDGKSLAIVDRSGDSNANQPPSISLVSLEGGAVKKVTTPSGSSEGDSSPAISPDGATLAFVRTEASGKSDIYLCDLASGGLRRLTFDDQSVRGLTWMADGHTLLYASDRARGWQLWRLSASGGSPREVLISGNQANWPAVSSKGNRLAYAESPSVASVWRSELGAPSGDRPLLRSNGRESGPSYSPDGQRIADVSDQTGKDEIWVSDAEGNNRVRLTNFEGPRLGWPNWSPDGKWLLFDVDGDRGREVYKTPAEPEGKPIRVLIGSSGASLSHDGKSIYFQSHGQIWKAAADGGQPEPLTKRQGSGNPEESVDGRYVYYRNRRTIWRAPTAGGEEEEVIEPEHDLLWGTIQPVKKGVYYLEFDRAARTMVVSFYNFDTKQNSIAFRIPRGDFRTSTFSVSPDGKHILYPKVDQSQTNLVLVENFK